MPVQARFSSHLLSKFKTMSLGDNALDSLGERIAVLDRNGDIITVNQAWREFSSICGASADATCEGANYFAICDTAVGEDAEIAHRISKYLKEMSLGVRREFVEEYPCHGPNAGQEAWFEIRATAFLHDGSRFLAVSHSDRTQRVKAERERERAGRMIARMRRLMRALHQARSRLRRAQDAAGIVAFEMDLSGAPLEAPEALQRLLKLSADTHFTSDILLTSADAADRPALAAALSHLATAGGHLRHEFRLASGEPEGQWIEVVGNGASVDGHAQRFIGVARDVTDRRRGEQQREMLSREINHRAQNVFAVVQAVLRASRPSEGDAYVEALEGRIVALARAHALLSEANWSGANLQAVLEAEVAPFRGTEGLSIIVDGPPVTLAPGMAQSFSLIFHELVTNSAKHGALSRFTGQLFVSWDIEGAARQLILRWRERGGPEIATPPTRRGFGSRIIVFTVRHQLGGSFVENWEPEGLNAVITVPLGSR